MTGRALLMTSGRALFGLDLADVREVLKAPPLHPVPLAPPGLLGAINVHESVVPVVDFGFLHGVSEKPGEQVVVLQRTPLALAVGVVRGLSGRSLVVPGGLRHSWVRQMFVSSYGPAGLIDPAALLESFERQLAGSPIAAPGGLSERSGG